MLKEKRIIRILGIVAVLTLGFPVLAQGAELKIGVIKIGTLLTQSKLAQSLKKAIQAKDKSYGQLAHRTEENLAKEKASLDKKRSILSPTAFQKEVSSFQSKVTAFQKDVQEKRQKLAIASQKGEKSLQNRIRQATSIYAKKNGYTLILVNENLPYADARSIKDVTKDVLGVLNAKFPKIGKLF